MEQTKEICRSLDVILKADRENLNSLNQSYNPSALKLLVSTIDYTDSLINLEVKALNQQIPIFRSDHSQESIAAALDDLSKISNEITIKTQTLSNTFYSQGSPVLNSLISNLNIQMQGTSDILELNKNIVPQLNALAVYGGASSQLSVQQANHLNTMLDDLQSKIN
jgi:putative membrane protein